MSFRAGDISGKRFGVLVVLKHVETRTTKYENGRIGYDPILECRCDCGSFVMKVKRNLTNGLGQSCEKQACKAIVRELRKFEKQKMRAK